MADASLVRTVRFRASHAYGRSDWSDDENRRVFGDSAEPHAHDFVLEVAVRGPIDEETGFVVDLGGLDALLGDVVRPLDGGDLNKAVDEVREGGMIPTTENLARWFYGRLAGRLPVGVRLERVRVAESDALAAEFRP